MNQLSLVFSSGEVLRAASLNQIVEKTNELTREIDSKYVKPSEGIGTSDLSSAVVSSLGRADTAIQSIKTINGQSILGSGNITISGSGGGITTENDPVFTASAAYNISASDISNWNGKQAAITDLATIRSGAALGATALQSYTEKYQGTYNKPSGGIPKTDLASAVQTSLEKADTALQSHQTLKTINGESLVGTGNIAISSGGTATPVVDNLTSTSTTSALSANQGSVLKGLIDGKQDSISNLSTIISNASNGNTAYGYFTSGKLPYSSLSGTPTIPTKLSDLTADATHRLVSDTEKNTWNGKQDAISNLSTITSNAANGNTAYGYFTNGKLPYSSLSGTPTIPTVTDTYSATSSNAMSGKAVASAISGKMNTVTLATVATSGSYDDLSGKPTIPTVTDTYSSTSSNAMSGKAVASAISGIKQVPSSTASNNGMVLSVVNGSAAWVSAATIYSGSAAPANTLGNNGDIYIQV